MTREAPPQQQEPQQYQEQPLYQLQPAASDDRFVRQSTDAYSGAAEVDYGAYTGGGGAFGWYADYPVGGGKKY